MNVETIKGFLDIIEKIKTPLSFWSLIIIVFGVTFYIALKYSVPYKAIIESIVKKLSQTGLYKIIRLFIICVAMIVFLFTILAFVAPLINSYIDKNYDVSYLEKRFKDTQTDFEIDKKYLQIIKYYEKHDYEKANLLIRETFPDNLLNSETDRMGLVVASYYAAHQFDKAAEEVIKRGIKLPFWNTEIKKDLAHCIRNYRLETTPNEAIELVTRLNLKYNYPKSLSYFWICLPMEVMDNINNSIHSLYSLNLEDLDKNDKEVMMYLIRKHRKDPFIDWAYYYVQDYDKALSLNGQIKDILLYAKGYRIMKELRANTDDVTNPNLLKKKLSELENTKINEAITLFKNYIKFYPKLPHADDASYWLSYSYILQKKYTNALDELTIQNLGNEDYDYYRNELFDIIIERKTVAPEKIAYYISKFNTKNAKYATVRLIDSFFSSNITNEIAINKFKKNIISSDDYVNLYLRFKLFQNKCVNNIYSNEIEKEGNNLSHNIANLQEKYSNEEESDDAYLMNELNDALENVLTKYKDVKPIFTNTKTTLQDISKTASLIRRKYKDYDLSISLTQYGLKRFSGQKSDYLHYLKIMALKDKYTSQMDYEVNQFLQLYPNSGYLDDVLSEYIYVKAYLQNDPLKADTLITLLFKKSPKGNARDNALYWIIEGYKNLCDCNIKNNISYCNKAKYYNNWMKKDFKFSKYALIAVKNQMEIAENTKSIINKECEEVYSEDDE